MGNPVEARSSALGTARLRLEDYCSRAPSQRPRRGLYRSGLHLRFLKQFLGDGDSIRASCMCRDKRESVGEKPYQLLRKLMDFELSVFHELCWRGLVSNTKKSKGAAKRKPKYLALTVATPGTTTKND
ncbi:hypothetical protein THAOC_24395 [Thalassiosira oceanica]|uniref:Uncharacterized protein n=1 Tax=Thalassiosira oceanica TaxID=159749 RepID=K0S4G6_THAOC|nr:hypothetical protein THAOC_24395 [Thalassiosira oceanica]|eukprot:EJK55826.1 hypothetical protein THAOC_24395 [Thalassiosira oceanica]